MQSAPVAQMTRNQWRRIRETLGLSQEELAKELGVDRTSITRYENGAAPIPESRMIALKLLQQAKESAA